jgi:hypothetical protein
LAVPRRRARLRGSLALRTGDDAGLRAARAHYQVALAQWQQRTDAFACRPRAAALAGLAWCNFADASTDLDCVGPSLVRRFRAALALDERYVPAWVGFGVACGLNARFDGAQAALAAALALDPMCAEAWFDLGRVQRARPPRRRPHQPARALHCNPALAFADPALARTR